MRSKLLRAGEGEEGRRRKAGSEVKEMSSGCLYIDILTIVEGVVRVTKSGFIVFSGRHRDKRFDHMCVKGFKNEDFVYLSLPLADVRKVYKKRFNATNNAVFIKMKDGK